MSLAKTCIQWIKKGAAAVAPFTDPSVTAAVAETVSRVRSEGFGAVEEYSKKFDGFSGPYRVPASAARHALEHCDTALKDALLTAIANVRTFHTHQKNILASSEWEISPGVRAGVRFLPVASAAVYIPGGRYPLPSSAIMGVVPAQVAGVGRIAAFSPPGKDGSIHPSVLATLALLGVDEIWAIGGAQAIAAAALGADPVRRVDFIVGPGNVYVTEAKRLLFGTVGIDGLAGPSEVLILADTSADPHCLAADLLAQAEHDPLAQSVLLCTTRDLADATLACVATHLESLATRDVARVSWENNGAVGICPLEEAIAYANTAAPEHLELALADPRAALARCTAYGAAFLGHSSAEVFGDYIAGTNHTLPTLGRARHAGGLWTGSFLRPLTHLDITPEAASRLSAPGRAIAEAEGLRAHANALRCRGLGERGKRI